MDKRMTSSFLSLALILSANVGWANERVKADNTAVNERDASGKTLTPPDQARGTSQDVETTRKIREQLMKESDLSMDAQNVKIITLKGVVNLRGPVKSASEKQRIGKIAASIAGNEAVRNELQIK